MKKILALVAAAFMLSSSVFATEVLHNIDFSIPIDSQTWDSDDFEDFFGENSADASMVGFNFIDYSRMTIAESGFSFLFGAYIGYDGLNLDFDGVDEDFAGMDFGVKFGWGGTPVNTDKFVLSIHGFFSPSFVIAGGSDTVVHYSYDGDTIYKDDADLIAYLFDFKIGADVVFAFRINDSIGLNAGFDLYTNIGAGFVGWSDDYGDESYVFSSVGGVGFVPRFGLTIFN